MMDMIDTWMVLVFPFLDFMPFGLPRYWLFRDRLRIPFRYIMAMMVILAAVNSMVFYYINLGGYETAAQWTTFMRYGFTLVNLVLSFLLIKESLSKLMFTYLLMMAWSFFVYGNANFIESRYFWELSELHPYLVYNMARVVIYMITCPFVFRFLCHTVRDALKIEDRIMWRYLWVIPLFPTLFGMLYCFTEDVYAYATWQFMVSRYLMLFGACYVSYVALKVLETSRRRVQLEAALEYADRSMSAQKKQFESLTSHMEEMKKARHDLRQHLAAVQSYIERDDKAGLADYIHLYQNHLPPDLRERYCQNDVVNAVVCYYAALAQDGGIGFETGIDYPENCPVSSTDITVLLGNLLENAVEACKRQANTAQTIKLRIKQRGGSALLILVDNPCLTPVVFDGDMPLSSKRKGAGIGTYSVREIAVRYGGTAQFEQKAGVFYASVLLNIVPDVTGKEAPAGNVCLSK